jgi:hypothetical protein
MDRASTLWQPAKRLSLNCSAATLDKNRSSTNRSLKCLLSTESAICSSRSRLPAPRQIAAKRQADFQVQMVRSDNLVSAPLILASRQLCLRIARWRWVSARE